MRKRLTGMMLAVAALALAAAGALAAAEAPAPLWARSSFDVQSTLLLSEVAGAPRNVGYRLSGRLTLRPLAAVEPHELLLELRVQDLQLEVRGAHARAEWQGRGAPWGQGRGEGGEWRALWRRGALAALWLPAAAPRDAANYMRALTGLLQFQLEEGQRNETDISGECEVTYETLSPTVFRKTKRRCAFESEAGEAGVRVRRVSRYTLAEDGALRELHAEELVWLSEGEGAGEQEAGVKARGWHALALRPAAPSPSPSPAPAAAAAAARLVEAPLALDDQQQEEQEERETLEAAMARHGAALAGGGRGAAAALGPMLSALAAAPTPALAALLRREDLQPMLPELCRLLGLTGSAEAWEAARALLAPAAADALESLTEHYLAGLALAPRAAPAVLAGVLALAEEAKLPAVAESALLAAAAVASRGAPAGARDTRDRLARALGRARGAEARALRLRALGNLREAGAAALLLGAAERGAGAGAEAALAALRGAALPPALAGRVLALAENASRPLAERALALELGAEALCGADARAVPLGLVRLARSLAAEGGEAAGELRRALWQRLETLAERPATAALRRMMPPDLNNWDAQAPSGTTSVLRRHLGWSLGREQAELVSAQLAHRQLLRRGRVALRARGADLLAVELWTRGLGALVGGEGEQEPGEGEGPAAGLALAVGGVALRPLTLFSGQAELLAHVWAGTAAAPTPVLRALVPLRSGRARVPLQAGAALALAARAGAALALDAQAAVSLWQRSARARLALRAAAHAECAARVRVAGARLQARVTLAAEARLRVASDLDFYDGTTLCVRADLDPHHLERSAELESTCGPRAHRVRRARSARWERAPRSLALGRDNSAACRTLTATDAEGDL